MHFGQGVYNIKYNLRLGKDVAELTQHPEMFNKEKAYTFSGY